MHMVDQLPAYALDCLDEQESAQVEEHLKRCAGCRSELKAYQEVVGSLALAVPEAGPAPWVRRRLMGRVGRTEQAREAPRRLAWWSALVALFRRSAPAWGVAALTAILALAAGNVWLWRQTHPKPGPAPEMIVVAMAAAEAAPGARGTLVISSDGEYGSLVVENLPTPDAAHRYQVWLERDGERISGGVFPVNDHGYGVLEILAPEPLMNYSSFRVTLEPVGGSPEPTTAVVLEGSP